MRFGLAWGKVLSQAAQILSALLCPLILKVYANLSNGMLRLVA